MLLFNSYEYFVKSQRTEAYLKLQTAAKHPRGWGDCYGHILVATGRAEVCVDPIMHPWDNAPFLPILQEAGGTFTDWKGVATIHGGDGISTTTAGKRWRCWVARNTGFDVVLLDPNE